MPTTRRTVPVVGALAALVATALVITLALSCGGDDGADPPPTSAPTTPPTTASVESEVEAAFVGYMQMSDRLLQDPDPSDPEIERWATGESLEQLRSSLESLQAQERMVRFGDNYGYEVLSVEIVDGDTASLRACLVDDAQTVDARSGEILAEAVTTARITQTLELVERAWRVSRTPAPEVVGEGVLTCD